MPILLLLFLLSGVGAGGYFYYTDTQAQIARLTENNAKLKIVAEDNQKAVDRLQEDIKIAQELSAKLTQELQEAEQYKNNLIGKLRRHDLTRLAMQKPGMIEKRVNNATAKIFEELEADSKPASSDAPAE
jgi:hypothetical protein